MPGGYVSGRKFLTDSEYNEAIEDARLIEELKKNTDFNDPASVSRLYSRMQTGEIRFKTIIGKDFDDSIYELEKNFRENPKVPDSSSKSKHKIKGSFNKKPVSSHKKNVSLADHKELGRNYKKDIKPKPDTDNKADLYEKEIDAQAEKILKKKNLIHRIVMIAAGIVAVGSLSYFCIYYKQTLEAQKAYNELAELKGSDPITDDIEQKPLFTLAEDQEMPEILDEYKNIYLKNKSIVGWLKIEDTNIDYPVMQTVNNEYYLNHDFEGNEDNNGALFVDYQCNIPFRSTNIIIYGHHMKSGKMFGNLKKYQSEDFEKEHDTIEFDTIYEKGKYQVMYVFKDNIRDAEDVSFKYYQFIDAVSEDEFYSNMNAMAEMSFYDTGVTAEYGDDILTLSTCEGSSSTSRFVVVAKRVEGENVSNVVNVTEND